MKKSFLFLFILTILFAACSQPEEDTRNPLLSFENVELRSLNNFYNYYSLDSDSWCVITGEASVDSTVLYEGKRSLLMNSDSSDGLKESYVYYCADFSEYEGDTVVFSGKYTCSASDNVDIAIGIFQVEFNRMVSDSLEIQSSGNTDWTAFRIAMPISKSAHDMLFFIRAKGNGSVWISDCHVTIDDKPLENFAGKTYKADTDHAFEEGSDIKLGQQTPQMIENLEVLARVWGFLKYYHPAVTNGNYNWDAELFRILPKIAHAKNKEERNKRLNKWIDSYGKIEETKEYSIDSPEMYSRIINMEWLTDESLFDEKLISKLKAIKNAKRDTKFNYYVLPYVPKIAFRFEREKRYPAITWEDQGFRLLTLFKFWNAMEYCSPYVDITDKPWPDVLKEYIPRFLRIRNKRNYDMALWQLVACIDDSRGELYIPNTGLGQTIWGMSYNTYGLPVTLVESDKHEIVIKSSNICELKRGDILLAINGEQVEDKIRKLSPYISASNQSQLIKAALTYIPYSDKNELPVTIIRDGEELQLLLKNFKSTQRDCITKVKEVKDYNLPSKKIAYINVGTMEPSEVTDIVRNNKDAKGLILDMRSPLRTNSYYTLYSLLFPEPKDFMWTSVNEKLAPGNYKLLDKVMIGTDNPNYFKGKVAIVVDEGPPYVESIIIAYRTIPRSAIIGSTTAGLGGSIGVLHLPGDMNFRFTVLGGYYPDWAISPRAGAKVDIEVKPSVEEYRSGQDVYIEKAIEYILNEQ